MLTANIPFHSIDFHAYISQIEKATPILKLGLFGKEKGLLVHIFIMQTSFMQHHYAKRCHLEVDSKYPLSFHWLTCTYILFWKDNTCIDKEKGRRQSPSRISGSKHRYDEKYKNGRELGRYDSCLTTSYFYGRQAFRNYSNFVASLLKAILEGVSLQVEAYDRKVTIKVQVELCGRFLRYMCELNGQDNVVYVLFYFPIEYQRKKCC